MSPSPSSAPKTQDAESNLSRPGLMEALNPLEDESHGGTEEVPREVRERAIRLAVDARRDPITRSGALRRICEQLGINPETLRNWVTLAENDEGHRPGTTTDDATRLVELDREPGAALGECDLEERVGFLRGGARPPTAVILEFIDDHKSEHGVEPICEAPQIAPSTYYAHRIRPPSARSLTDVATTAEIERAHAEIFGVYGVRNVRAQLHRKGHAVARCTVERLMSAVGLRGVTRAKGPRTTMPGSGPDIHPDLVKRASTATGPDQLWVADITYCRTITGWVYAAVVTDVHSQRVVG